MVDQHVPDERTASTLQYSCSGGTLNPGNLKIKIQVFNSGAVPSYTDYQIFRDYGRVPGLDIAYVRNGWLYHTEFDEEKYIMEGAIQRAGENALSLVVALANSPHLHNATIKAEESKEKIVRFLTVLIRQFRFSSMCLDCSQFNMEAF